MAAFRRKAPTERPAVDQISSNQGSRIMPGSQLPCSSIARNMFRACRSSISCAGRIGRRQSSAPYAYMTPCRAAKAPGSRDGGSARLGGHADASTRSGRRVYAGRATIFDIRGARPILLGEEQSRPHVPREVGHRALPAYARRGGRFGAHWRRRSSAMPAAEEWDPRKITIGTPVPHPPRGMFADLGVRLGLYRADSRRCSTAPEGIDALSPPSPWVDPLFSSGPAGPPPRSDETSSRSIGYQAPLPRRPGVEKVEAGPEGRGGGSAFRDKPLRQSRRVGLIEVHPGSKVGTREAAAGTIASSSSAAGGRHGTRRNVPGGQPVVLQDLAKLGRHRRRPGAACRNRPAICGERAGRSPPCLAHSTGARSQRSARGSERAERRIPVPARPRWA